VKEADTSQIIGDYPDGILYHLVTSGNGRKSFENLFTHFLKYFAWSWRLTSANKPFTLLFVVQMLQFPNVEIVF